MNFLGFSSPFSQQIKDNIQITDYKVVSFLDGFFDLDQHQFENLIQLLPYCDDTLWESKKRAWNRMRDDSLKDSLGSCISFFIVEPTLHDPIYIANLISKVDKYNQIDNIWVYPDKQEAVQRRNNSVSKLPYQNEY